MTTKVAKKRVKAGTSKMSAEDKKALFVEAYLSNGGNATDAALQAGYSKGGASKQGYRMSKDPAVMSMLESRRASMFSELERRRVDRAADIELNTERLVKEISRIAFSDPRNIMHSDGKIKMPHELDADTAAAISSFEVTFDGSIKYKFWDKNSAQERASKVIGLFEKDNKQKADPLTALIESLSGNVLGVAKNSNDEGE